MCALCVWRVLSTLGTAHCLNAPVKRSRYIIAHVFIRPYLTYDYYWGRKPLPPASLFLGGA